MEVEHKIQAIVKKYNTGTHSLDELLSMKDHLAGYRVYLAGEVANAYEYKNLTEFAYKSSTSDYFLEAEGTIDERKKRAEKSSAEAREDFIKWDNAYKRLYLLYDATSDVIQAMTQRIAHGKREIDEATRI